jgi:tetrahydromethanopterin S-methyltransferase subunit G
MGVWWCFDRRIPLSDEQRIDRLETRMDRLETKMDNGFAEMRTEIGASRSEARDGYRTLLGIVLAMFVTMIFGFAGLLAGILTQVG